MPVDLARTFLEIVRSGSFVGAAERLHLTQTAVTARVHSLEGQLDCSLFVRNRSGVTLTAQGEAFVEYANRMVQAWEQAQQQVSRLGEELPSLRLGAEASLGDPLLLSWLTELRKALPACRLEAQIGESESLLRALDQGLLDAALLYQPIYWPGLKVELLLEEKLIQVAHAQQPEPDIYVPWSEDFRRQHLAALPGEQRAAMSFNQGPLALQYLLAVGGRGYFRARAVQRYLDNGQLRRIAQAPEFTYPVYLVYSLNCRAPALAQGLALLKTAMLSAENSWNFQG